MRALLLALAVLAAGCTSDRVRDEPAQRLDIDGWEVTHHRPGEPVIEAATSPNLTVRGEVPLRPEEVLLGVHDGPVESDLYIAVAAHGPRNASGFAFPLFALEVSFAPPGPEQSVVARCEPGGSAGNASSGRASVAWVGGQGACMVTAVLPGLDADWRIQWDLRVHHATNVSYSAGRIANDPFAPTGGIVIRHPPCTGLPEQFREAHRERWSDVPWSTTPEALRAEGMPTYALALEHPGTYYGICHDERTRLHAAREAQRAAGRDPFVIEYQGTQYGTAAVVE